MGTRLALLTLLPALVSVAVGTPAAAQPEADRGGARDASGLWLPEPLDHPRRRSATEEALATVPGVGAVLGPLELKDAAGGTVALRERAGARGTVLVLLRSLAWSPFCRAQLSAWQAREEELGEVGYGLAIVTTEPLDEQAPGVLLSDPDGRALSSVGLRNELIDPREEGYGMPYPGTLVLDREGAVTHRFFELHHARRAAPGTVLAALGAEPSAPDGAILAGRGLTARAGLLDPALTLEGQSLLLVRLELDPGLYIYTDPLPQGFIATTVEVLPTEGLRYQRVEYPEASPKEFPDLGVTLPVYRGVADFLVPVRATPELLGPEVEDPPNGLPIFVRVHYQTCSERLCYTPQDLDLYLEVPVEHVELSPGARR